MVNKKKLGLRLHGLGRFAGALWAFSLFVIITPYMNFINIVDPLTWFAGMAFVFAGGEFVYNALTIWPEKGKLIGLTPTIMMMILGVVNFVFAGMIFLNYFNPYTNHSEWIGFASITLGLGTLSLFITGIYEIYAGRHAVKELKAKLNIH